MINKYSIWAAAASASLLISTTVQAIPTSEITFDSSSLCGTYKGDLTEGRFFILSLDSDNELTVSTDGHVQSVEDSKGEVLLDQGGHNYRYLAKHSGSHNLKMVGRSTSEVEFCVIR